MPSPDPTVIRASGVDAHATAAGGPVTLPASDRAADPGTSDPIELRTQHLTLRPMPPAAAARLPADRAGAAALLGVALDDEWPLPDILDLMPVHALRTGAAARCSIWVMIETATSTVVGDVGFLDPPNEAGEMETGYSVVPSRRRRGYATEALAVLTGWAFEQPEVTAIVAGTDPDNDVSQRVLQRAGFEPAAPEPAELRWRLERAGASKA
jgi:ribosomal-protein-alanine N-acetyltransferase